MTTIAGASNTSAGTRICIVGAGSYNWTPMLVQDIALTPDIAGTLVLHDIAPEPLAEMTRLAQLIVNAAGTHLTIEATTDRDTALRDAQFVIVTIAVGGLAAMRRDLEIPARYGVMQSVGDTVGPGGLARGLRNIPVMVDLARAMERLCPDAWLLNLTNPMATTTRAVVKATSIRVIGLCHELDGVRRTLTRMFGVTDDDIDLVVAGTNHLPWLLDLRIRGEDGFQLLRDAVQSGVAIPLKPDSVGPKAPFQDRWQVKLALLDAFGRFPAAGDRHVAEFFPWFLTAETRSGEQYGVLLTTIEHRMEIGRNARDEVTGWLDGRQPIPLNRSREAVADIIAAILTSRPHHTVVNLPNIGQIDNLPRGAIVETLGIVGASGAHALAAGPLPPAILDTVHCHVINQELIVDAALSGDRSLALQALLNDPLVRDFRTAPQMLDELVGDAG